MARRYDSSTTTFSPEGRLHQVEYAIEAINNAGTCVGLKCSDGIILASERKVTSKLLAPSKTSEKTYKVDGHCVLSVAGLSSDASILIDQARLRSQRYYYQYQEPIPIEQIVEHICNYKQSYTQYGGLRPFGCSFLFAGYDEHFGMQLYQTDPSGNYSGWQATVIGANNSAGKSFLKNEYAKDQDGPPTVSDGLKLAVKVLNKTMDSTGNSAEKYELFCLRFDPTAADGSNVSHHVLTDDETQKVLDDVEREQANQGDA
mmetsp:Transcript_6536/g.12578  ORF Transcript_6536/g.12578 Transcript_6536/m.12578 type:complete len:259 (-) Transcript_6536:127-903(-)|eukprot:CAMPEP_0182452846 /NCGR_PEP_ID=MMETSP1319-20130603/165_1 /TAXON_ID=172717 /ORGANISM="Bolidomonas pacifica, Strain RCC208" /LENGTH=258 /DNA_ID=CAMNT_0024650723 /DNA_START=392 /DNA_END=1168 /DNA_ORIENTATION=-